MTIRLYLTIAAVVAILYALAFLLIPVTASLFFSDFAEPRAVLYLRFCGAAILAWGIDRMVRQEFSGLGTNTWRSNRQRCGTCHQYHLKRRRNCSRLAQHEGLGYDRCARVAVAWG